MDEDHEGNGSTTWTGPWRLLVGAAAVSVIGDLLSSVAVAAYLLEQRSATWVAMYFVAGLAARVVAAPIGGRFVDRHPGVEVLVVADVARAVLFLAVACAVALDATAMVVVGLTTIAAALGGVHRPAFASLIPLVVPDRELESANATIAATHQVGWIVGPAIGAVIATWWGVGPAVLMNAATFVVAALLTAAVRPAPRSCRSGGDAPSADERRASGQLLRALAVPLLAGAGLMIVFGAENVVHPLITRDNWHLDPAVAGMLVTAAGLGGLLGATFAGRVARRLGALRALVVAVAATLGTFAGLAVAPNLGWGIALCAVGGAVGLVYDVAATTMVQRAAPPRSIGRAFGLLEAVDGGAQLVGIILVPILLGVVGLPACVFALSGCGLVLLFAALTLTGRQRPFADQTASEGGDDHEHEHQQAGPPARQVLTPAD